MVAPVRIATHVIGPGAPCFVIAEAGVNHNGSVDLAMQLVDTAAKAGADAVKFQTFKSEDLISPVAPKAGYQKETTGANESQLEMVRKLELPKEAFRTLAERAQALGILFLSTPFDDTSADVLVSIGVPAFKIGSGELTNTRFLARLAKFGKPLILSTGMANLGEVATAVRAIRENGNPPLVLLHCVSNYPAAPADSNLRAMATMQAEFKIPVGYSDHTLGDEVSLAAVALGACVIEKHFTLDTSLPGPDHRASLPPAELAALTRRIRAVESSLGHGRKEPAASEAGTAAVARRSVVAAVDIDAGTILTEQLLTLRRPGSGLPPDALPTLIGRKLVRALKAGDVVQAEFIS